MLKHVLAIRCGRGSEMFLDAWESDPAKALAWIEFAQRCGLWIDIASCETLEAL